MRLLNTFILALLCLLLIPACNFTEGQAALPMAEKEFGWATEIDIKYEREHPKLYAEYVQARKWLNDPGSVRNALAAARSKLAGILRENPKFAPAYIEMARYTIKNGFIDSNNFHYRTLEDAEIQVQKALMVEPDYADAYVLLGHIYTEDRRFFKAHAALFKAAEIGTENPWLSLNFAALVEMQGGNEEAFKRYEQVLESDVKVPNALRAAYSGAINYLTFAGEYEKADRYFQEKLAQFPDAAYTWGNYAMFTLRYMRDYEKAIEFARKSLSLRTYGYGREYLAAALLTKWHDLKSRPGRSDEAEKAYREAFEQDVQLANLLCRLEYHEATRDVAAAVTERINKDLDKERQIKSRCSEG